MLGILLSAPLLTLLLLMFPLLLCWLYLFPMPESARLAGDPDILQRLWAAELLHQNPGGWPAGDRQTAVRRPDSKDSQGNRVQRIGVGSSSIKAQVVLGRVVIVYVCLQGSVGAILSRKDDTDSQDLVCQQLGKPTHTNTSKPFGEIVLSWTPEEHHCAARLSDDRYILCAFVLLPGRSESPAGEERGGSVWRRAAEICLRCRLHPEGRHVSKQPIGGM